MGMKSSGSSQPAGRDARGARLRVGGGAAAGCGLRRLPGRVRFRRAGAALDEVDVVAGGGAGEQHALQGGGAQDASVEVGEDGGEVGGAEAGGDGVEVGGGGALADGVDEVAAVAEQGAGDVEEDRDVVGQSGGGVIRAGSGGEATAEGRWARQGIVSGYGKLC